MLSYPEDLVVAEDGKSTTISVAERLAFGRPQDITRDPPVVHMCQRSLETAQLRTGRARPVG